MFWLFWKLGKYATSTQNAQKRESAYFEHENLSVLCMSQ